jgi:hypothetical protein
MSVTTVRTRDQKLADAKFAFDALREELGSKDLRELITKLAEFPAPQKDAPPEAIVAYASLVQGSMTLAQIASANDRTALTAAVNLMAGTVGREREIED